MNRKTSLFPPALITLFAALATGCEDPNFKEWHEDKASGTVVVSVPWVCDQTRLTQVPTRENVTLTLPVNKVKHAIARHLDYKNAGLEVSSPDFDRMLELSRKTPTLDFSQCASNFMADMREMAVEACAHLTPGTAARSTLDIAGDAEILVDNCEIYVDILLRKLRDTETGFYRGGSISPFLPGAESIPKLTEQSLNDMTEALRASCGAGLAGEYRYLDGRMLDRLAGLAPTLEHECRNGIFGLYLDLLDQVKPVNCSEGSYFCTAEAQAIRAVLMKLESVGMKPSAIDSAPLSDNRCVNLTFGGGTGIDAVLHSLNVDLQGILKCREPGKGEEILYNGNHGSPAPSKYVLTKKDGASPAAYTATINPKFKNLDDLSKARTCLAEASPRMKGPQGETLTIALYQDAPTKTRPPVSEIHSLAASSRSRSTAWAADIECSTVVHEILHLLGLVDEYREEEIGLARGKNGDWIEVETGAVLPGYNCRATYFSGAINVMADDQLAFDPAFESGSLLSSEQFFFIIDPDCPRKSKRYRFCAAASYQTAYDELSDTYPSVKCDPRIARACKTPLGRGAGAVSE